MPPGSAPEETCVPITSNVCLWTFNICSIREIWLYSWLYSTIKYNGNLKTHSIFLGTPLFHISFMFSKLLIIQKFRNYGKRISPGKVKSKSEGLTKAPECENKISLLAFQFVISFLSLCYPLWYRFLCLQFCVLFSEIGTPKQHRLRPTNLDLLLGKIEILQKNKAREKSQGALPTILWFLYSPVSASCHNFGRILTPFHCFCLAVWRLWEEFLI